MAGNADLSTAQLRAQVRAIQTLLASRGWAVVRERMESEIRAAAMQIGANATMDLAEVHYRRGAIWAGEQLMSMPEKLLLPLENDLAYREGMERHAAGMVRPKFGDDA